MRTAVTWLVAALMLAISYMLIVYAHAGPPNGVATPEAEWFRSLRRPGGGSCCAETADGAPDCYRMDDGTVRAVGEHYEFLASVAVFGGQIGDSKWHRIPDSVLIRGRKLAELGGNPTGLWVVCAMYGYNQLMGDDSKVLVLCAVPPSQT